MATVKFTQSELIDLDSRARKTTTAAFTTDRSKARVFENEGDRMSEIKFIAGVYELGEDELVALDVDEGLCIGLRLHGGPVVFYMEDLLE